MEAITLPRKFIFLQGQYQEEVPLPDPGPLFTPQAVCSHYAAFYPELTNANIEGPQLTREGAVFKLMPVMGTKA